MTVKAGYLFGSAFKGSKTIFVGTDPSVYMYDNLVDAVAVANNDDVIVVEDGTYSLTATLVINKPLTIVGNGKVEINGGTLGVASKMITINVPVAYSAAAYNTFENIKFVNAYAAADVFEIDNNGGSSQDLYVNFKNCSIDCESTGLAIDLNHTTAAKNVYLSMFGNTSDVVDAISAEIAKAGDLIKVEGITMGGTITTNAGAVAGQIIFKDAMVPAGAALAGGHASQLAYAEYCMSYTGTTHALVVTGDLTGSQTESAILPVS